MQDKIIKCRLNNKMYDDVIKYCSQHGITTSQYIRNCISFSLKCAARKKGGNDGGVSAQEWIDKFYDDYMKGVEKSGYFND